MKAYTQRLMSRKLAKLFAKYDFFKDDKPADDVYDILL